MKGLISKIRGWHPRMSSVVTSGVLAVVLAAALVYFTTATGTYPVNATFASAQGVFPGAAVRLLGVRVGTVTDVQYSHGAVHIVMAVNGNQALPADLHAALVAPLLLGQPDVELSPGYTGGPTFQRGSTIPENRTAVPVSTDELLHQLQRVLGAVKTHSMHDLVGNLATDLAGQGSQLNQLISGAAGTLRLLADKGNDLGRLNGSLAQLTGTLRSHESELLSLIQGYDTVAGIVASHQQALGAGLDDLSKASAQLAALLSPNLKPLAQDVAVIATAGRTLDRNLSNLDTVMSSSRALFAAAHRAYDPRYQWLNLNSQTAPGLTTSYLEGLVRDRLAGICRRILAHHSSGLSPAQKKTLATCGNPESGYFNPVLKIIPTLLNGGTPSGPSGSSPSPGSLIAPGLKTIPGLTPSQQKNVTGAATGSVSKATTTTTTSRHHKKKKKVCKAGIDGAIDCVLGPLPTSTSGGTAVTTTSVSNILGSILFGFGGWR
jgi:virulence factor Mce-like protein